LYAVTGVQTCAPSDLHRRPSSLRDCSCLCLLRDHKARSHARSNPRKLRSGAPPYIGRLVHSIGRLHHTARPGSQVAQPSFITRVACTCGARRLPASLIRSPPPPVPTSRCEFASLSRVSVWFTKLRASARALLDRLAAFLAAGGSERQGRLLLPERRLVRRVGKVGADRAAHQLRHRQIHCRGLGPQRPVKIRIQVHGAFLGGHGASMRPLRRPYQGTMVRNRRHGV